MLNFIHAELRRRLRLLTVLRLITEVRLMTVLTVLTKTGLKPRRSRQIENMRKEQAIVHEQFLSRKEGS